MTTRKTIFCHPELRMMSEVKRWGIVPMLDDQNVADHSFYVALYVSQLAKIQGMDAERRCYLVERALIHDIPEIRTGDMPGPVKRRVTHPGDLNHFEAQVISDLHINLETPPGGWLDSDRFILKAANLMDECWKIAWENKKGNSLARIDDSLDRLSGFLRALKIEEVFADFYFALKKFRDEGITYPTDTKESSDVPE